MIFFSDGPYCTQSNQQPGFRPFCIFCIVGWAPHCYGHFCWGRLRNFLHLGWGNERNSCKQICNAHSCWYRIPYCCTSIFPRSQVKTWNLSLVRVKLSLVWQSIRHFFASWKIVKLTTVRLKNHMQIVTRKNISENVSENCARNTNIKWLLLPLLIELISLKCANFSENCCSIHFWEFLFIFWIFYAVRFFFICIVKSANCLFYFDLKYLITIISWQNFYVRITSRICRVLNFKRFNCIKFKK